MFTKINLIFFKTKKHLVLMYEVLVSALPIFPGSCPPSIFGTNELNYRVRDGNGWTLIVINTDYDCKMTHSIY